jgi:hypothetical protein
VKKGIVTTKKIVFSSGMKNAANVSQDARPVPLQKEGMIRINVGNISNLNS